MPVIYLEHPVHGRKVATLEAEAEYDEKNGWSRYDPDMPPVVEEALSDTEEVPQFLAVNTLTLKNRPGRPRKVN